MLCSSEVIQKRSIFGCISLIIIWFCSALLRGFSLLFLVILLLSVPVKLFKSNVEHLRTTEARMLIPTSV